MTLHDVVFVILPSLGGGIALGLAFFVLLRNNVRLYFEGRRVVAVLLQAGRFTLAVAVFGAAVHFGAMALLTCALGFFIGRRLALRQTGEATT